MSAYTTIFPLPTQSSTGKQIVCKFCRKTRYANVRNTEHVRGIQAIFLYMFVPNGSVFAVSCDNIHTLPTLGVCYADLAMPKIGERWKKYKRVGRKAKRHVTYTYLRIYIDMCLPTYIYYIHFRVWRTCMLVLVHQPDRSS